MARGGWGVFDFAEAAVAQQGAQERGFAGVGVPHDGEGKGLFVHNIFLLCLNTRSIPSVYKGKAAYFHSGGN